VDGEENWKQQLPISTLLSLLAERGRGRGPDPPKCIKISKVISETDPKMAKLPRWIKS
jgi:hypothetical protein